MAEGTRARIKRNKIEMDPIGWAIERIDDPNDDRTRAQIAECINMNVTTMAR